MYFWHMLDLKWQCWVIYSILTKHEDTEVSALRRRGPWKLASNSYTDFRMELWWKMNFRIKIEDRPFVCGTFIPRLFRTIDVTNFFVTKNCRQCRTRVSKLFYCKISQTADPRSFIRVRSKSSTIGLCSLSGRC